jgi:hypothetical protein
MRVEPHQWPRAFGLAYRVPGSFRRRIDSARPCTSLDLPQKSAPGLSICPALIRRADMSVRPPERLAAARIGSDRLFDRTNPTNERKPKCA